MDRFSQILYDLGQEIGEPLHTDRNRLCKLNYQDELHLQIEYLEEKEQLLLAAFLCEVPPGKYRETLLKEALKTNEEYPRLGVLAYSPRNNQLVLFETLYAPHMTGQKLFDLLQRFIQKGLSWKTAVEKGLPLPSPQTKVEGSGKMFGLK